MTIFTGNLVADAKTRFVEKLGKSVTEFTVAENYPTTRGERGTQYYAISIWGDRGTNLFPYLKKGKEVTVTGRVKAVKPWYSEKTKEWKTGLKMDNPGIELRGSSKVQDDAAEEAAADGPAEADIEAVDDIPEVEKPF